MRRRIELERARDARALQKAAVHPRLAGRRKGCKKRQLENLTVWEMKKVKESRKGSKTYT